MGWYSRYIFPRVLDWVLGTAEQEQYRRETLAPVRGQVLEIGFGTGLNLPHYPEQVESLTVIDSEDMLPRRVEQRIAAARLPVKRLQLDASGRLPFADCSFDWAVTTWTLCSIERVASALAEIRRVLKPEGHYVFLEHGRSADPAVARRQDFLNPIWKFISYGCQINRPMDRLIEDAGLEITSLERFLLPQAPRTHGEVYRGIAQPAK
jgi:ubiquinone/menaquinone biosynthesis C-methylase UbiE